MMDFKSLIKKGFLLLERLLRSLDEKEEFLAQVRDRVREWEWVNRIFSINVLILIWMERGVSAGRSTGWDKSIIRPFLLKSEVRLGKSSRFG